MTDYDDAEVPLVLGSLRGRRNFKLKWSNDFQHEVYMLQSPLRDYIWQPGENVAQCVCAHPAYFGYPDKVEPFFVREHVAGKDHTCGFYAYTNHLKYDYENGTNAVGVIEAYGRITVGNLGFRAEKAKIVAIHFKEELGPLEQRVFERTYPDIRVFTDPAIMFDRVKLVSMDGPIKYPEPTSMARAFRLNRCPECANTFFFEGGVFVCHVCQKGWKASFVMDVIHNNFWGLPG